MTAYCIPRPVLSSKAYWEVVHALEMRHDRLYDVMLVNHARSGARLSVRYLTLSRASVANQQISERTASIRLDKDERPKVLLTSVIGGLR